MLCSNGSTTAGVRSPDELLQLYHRDHPRSSCRHSPTSPTRSTVGAKKPRIGLLTPSRMQSPHRLQPAGQPGLGEQSAMADSPAAASAGSAASTASVSEASDERKMDEDYQPQHPGSSQASSSDEANEDEEEEEMEERKDSAHRSRQRAKPAQRRPAPPAASFPSAGPAPFTVEEEPVDEEPIPPSSAGGPPPPKPAMEAEEEPGLCAVRATLELRKGSAITLCLPGPPDHASPPIALSASPRLPHIRSAPTVAEYANWLCSSEVTERCIDGRLFTPLSLLLVSRAEPHHPASSVLPTQVIVDSPILPLSLCCGLCALQAHCPSSGVLTGDFDGAQPMAGGVGGWWLLRLRCDEVSASALGKASARSGKRRRRGSQQPRTLSTAASPSVKQSFAMFDEEVERLSRLRAATSSAYLTRRRNPNSLTLVQDQRKAEQLRLLEQLTEAGVAGNKEVRLQPPTAAMTAPQTHVQPGTEGSGEVEDKDDDGDEAGLISLVYHQADSRGGGWMGKVQQPPPSSLAFLCSCSHLQLTSTYLASLEVEWSVGSFFQQSVQEKAGGGLPGSHRSHRRHRPTQPRGARDGPQPPPLPASAVVSSRGGGGGG